MPSPILNPTPISPRTNWERELVRIWEEVLQRSPVGIQENFFDLGGTSVQAARVFARIEEAFHQRLPLSVILGSPTIEQLAATLLPGKSDNRKAHVVPIQPEGEKPVFFCVGGGVLWRPVTERLGTDQPVFNISLEPRAVEEMKGPNSMEKLARYMVAALLEKQPQGPYYLGGFCAEGVFAYEIARQLTMYGHEVGLLALVETRNPSPHLKLRLSNDLRRGAIRVAFQVNEICQMIKTRDVSQYVRARSEQLRRFKLRMSSILSPGFRLRARQAGQVDPWESLYLEANSFKPKSLSCPTAIFRCADWPILSAGDPYFGWREFLTGPSETHEVPGDHMGILRDPSVGVLADKLRACLVKARHVDSSNFDLAIEAEGKFSLGQSRA
jgi:thioesterase domain-containing protein